MQHKVKQGESLWLIAKKNKLADWKDLYAHPKNASLRKRRPDPNAIYPGDILFVPPARPNKKGHQGATSTAHPFKLPPGGGLSNLKWEPAEGTFGKVASAKLSGDADLPDGTAVTFTCVDKGELQVPLPELQGTVKGKKISLEWDLTELNQRPEVYLLDIETVVADKQISGNPATLKLEDRRCTASAIKVQPFLLQQQKKGQKEDGRAPNRDGLLQVVADADMKWSLESPMHVFGKRGKEERKEAAERARSVRALRKHYGGLKNVPGFVKDFQKQKWGQQAPTRTGKFTMAYCHGGTADLDAQLLLPQPCTKAHSFRLTGPKSEDLKPAGHKLALPWDGKAGLPAKDTKPTIYVLTGRGCEGKERTVTVEVYPSDQIVFSAGFDSSPLTSITNRISSILKLTGFGEFSISFSVAGFGFFGWREEGDPGEWRVYHARELSISGGVKLALSLRLSFITIFTGIPPSALKYFADIGLTIGIEFALSLKYLWERKFYPPSAKTPEARADKAGFEAVGGAHLGVYARIGPGELLSVEAVGKATSSLKFSCQPAYESDKFLLKSPKLEMTPVEFIITVTTHLLLVKHEKEWKFTWYKPDPTDPLYPPRGKEKEAKYKQWELFDFSKKYDSNARASGANVA